VVAAFSYEYGLFMVEEIQKTEIMREEKAGKCRGND